MNHNLHYPNLEHCDVEPTSGTVNKNPPPSASLSDKILEQMTAPLPVLYDFRIEKEVLKKNTQDSSLSTIIAKNKMDITQNFTSYQKSILQKMKSITNASQERCASILMKTNFKLNESIEAYYRGGP
jgi:hypothetical protein